MAVWYLGIVVRVSADDHVLLKEHYRQEDFDELLIERNRYGAIWVHFAVRTKDNRRKILFINA